MVAARNIPETDGRHVATASAVAATFSHLATAPLGGAGAELGDPRQRWLACADRKGESLADRACLHDAEREPGPRSEVRMAKPAAQMDRGGVGRPQSARRERAASTGARQHDLCARRNSFEVQRQNDRVVRAETERPIQGWGIQGGAYGHGLRYRRRGNRHQGQDRSHGHERTRPAATPASHTSPAVLPSLCVNKSVHRDGLSQTRALPWQRAPMSDTAPRACEFCGQSLAGFRSDARYCGSSCRTEASRLSRLLTGRSVTNYAKPKARLAAVGRARHSRAQKP